MMFNQILKNETTLETMDFVAMLLEELDAMVVTGSRWTTPEEINLHCFNKGCQAALRAVLVQPNEGVDVALDVLDEHLP